MKEGSKMDEKLVIGFWSSGYQTYLCRRGDELFKKEIKAVEACVSAILEELRGRCKTVEDLVREYKKAEEWVDKIKSITPKFGYSLDDLGEFCEAPPSEYITDSAFYLRYRELEGKVTLPYEEAAPTEPVFCPVPEAIAGES